MKFGKLPARPDAEAMSKEAAWRRAVIDGALEHERCACFLALMQVAPADGVISISAATARSIASALRAAGHPMSPYDVRRRPSK